MSTANGRDWDSSEGSIGKLSTSPVVRYLRIRAGVRREYPNFFLQTKIRAPIDHGVYALLDMHEDVLSSKFCLYDGVPRWVIDKSVPKHAFPWPMKGAI